MSKLDEKVALITGGSRGIGAAIAKRLAADGASVALTYAKEASAASAVVKTIELSGGKAVAIQANSETLRGDHARRDGSGDRHQRPRDAGRDAGSAQAHEAWRSHHHHRLVRGRTCPSAWARSLLGHEGRREDVQSGVGQRRGVPAHKLQP